MASPLWNIALANTNASKFNKFYLFFNLKLLHMQKIYLTLLLALSFSFSWAQSENCSGAVLLTNGTCVVGTAGAS